jgi:hypothetical protein
VERSFFGFEADRLRRHMPNPVDKDEVFWGLSCAGSRTFTADFGAGPAAEAMCPIADMVLVRECPIADMVLVRESPIAGMVLERARARAQLPTWC